MRAVNSILLIISGFLSTTSWGQTSPPAVVRGHFLTDSIEIGRPFRYALTYRHSPRVDVLFPDTAHAFQPYRVQKVDSYATLTSGTGDLAVSRDSAVYTLVSFETDSAQLLRVPVRMINEVDCTAQWTQTDTVFLKSKLPPAIADASKPLPITLATETTLAPLQQQFNYLALIKGLLLISSTLVLLYALFGRAIRRQWRLYQLNRRHSRFLRNYDQLSQRLNSFTASETANRAVIMWKMYLERLDRQPYMSLTTPELAERLNDQRVADALRQTDRMIYGGTFSDQSERALSVLRDVATQTYVRSRTRLQRSVSQATQPSPVS
ncbi:hypothetical protein [Spirosoma koreense]